MKTWLLDTGPLVAYLDASDPAHGQVAQRLDAFTGRLLTTAAVITETMYFVGGSVEGPQAVAEFVAVNRIAVHGNGSAAELRAAGALMRRYENVPMDYADATLLLLADTSGSGEILTLDRRGFRTYRTPAGARPRLVLDMA